MTGVSDWLPYRGAQVCATCAKPLCECRDDQWRGTVVIDTASEPGSWKRHDRHTACMRTIPPEAGDTLRRPTPAPSCVSGDRFSGEGR